jgi:hypothetical protein
MSIWTTLKALGALAVMTAYAFSIPRIHDAVRENAIESAERGVYVKTSCLQKGTPDCIRHEAVDQLQDVVLPTALWSLGLLALIVACIIGMYIYLKPSLDHIRDLSK